MKHLVLLHGALGHPEQFAHLIPELSKNYTVHTILFHGHGQSDFPKEELSMSTYVNQVHAYIKANDIDKTSFFGYSMGGYVALCFACQFPEMTDDIMTLATKYEWNPEIAQKETKMLNAQTILEKVPQFADKLIKLHGAKTWEKLTIELSRLLTHLGQQPHLTPESLSRIQSKTQLMVGDKDKMVSVLETYQVFTQLHNSRFVVLPNTIHPLETVDSDVLLMLIKKFFG